MTIPARFAIVREPIDRIRLARALTMTAILLALAIGSAFGAGSSRPSFGGGDRESDGAENAVQLYASGIEAIAAEKYGEALSLLERADREDPDNPDILNMLAYSNRKLGKLDRALEHYGQALELRPRFPEAREYLGEAYVEAALEQLRILASYGETAARERAALAATLRDAADRLDAEAAIDVVPPRRAW